MLKSSRVELSGRRNGVHKSIFDLRQIHVAAGIKAPAKPNDLEDPVDESVEMDEFLAIVQDTSSTRDPLEVSIDEVAMPLLLVGLMTLPSLPDRRTCVDHTVEMLADER